jgi:hypothetical protein
MGNLPGPILGLRLSPSAASDSGPAESELSGTLRLAASNVRATESSGVMVGAVGIEHDPILLSPAI